MTLISLYKWLYNRYGPQRWWPADTPFEMMVGAILTQQTRWENVEKAIECMKIKGLLSPEKIIKAGEELTECIKITGFYRQKEKRLKALSRFLIEMGEELWKMDTLSLRKALLSVEGVGKETADSILLYAFERPVFVVDAYTLRILRCAGVSGKRYEEVRKLFESSLPADVELYKEYHALLVAHGKNACSKNMCEDCIVKHLKL